MKLRQLLYSTVAAIGVAALVTVVPAPASAQQATAVAIDNDDIGGVVRGPSGPEAGVWVIAETTELPTRFIKIVVTDDQGRYVIPDLPLNVNYQVWVRGYGLIDSPKMRAKPGMQLNLTAVPAPDERSAAQYYPAAYWYAMMKIPGPEQFGGKGEVPEKITLPHYLNLMKNNGCIGCHQLGQESTRTIPAGLGAYKSHEDAWIRRVQSGQSGEQMTSQLAGLLGGAPFKYFGDWTERVAKGELPKYKPQRPQGVERNIVITQWFWGEADKYLHDLIASDRRKPTVNAYGKVYGSPEYATDNVPMLDPKTHQVSFYKLPVQDSNMPESLGPGHAAALNPLQPSPYWGEKKLWDTRANNHNAMFDKDGRVWFTHSVRGRNNPDFCKKGSDHPSAKLFPLEQSSRQLGFLDPKTQKYTFVDTCYQTHHLQFAYDANETLWTSGGGAVTGWINTKILNETGDTVKSQGWTAHILDTNGDGKRGEYTEPNQPMDPTKDRRVPLGYYAIMPNPADGSVWGTIAALGPAMVSHPGGVIRLDTSGGKQPHEALTEVYFPPMPGFGVRGGDIDSKGVLWVSLASGHIGSFDRSKCKVLRGPTATGNHCPEGWAFYQYPGPGFDGLGENSVESSYYSWVDQHDVFGLGKDVPMSTANQMDGLVALKDGKMVSMKIPYPLGFYAKGFDGRIDDPNAGWKGKGLWSSSGDRTPWLSEGGKGTLPRAVQFQIRPDPLAK